MVGTIYCKSPAEKPNVCTKALAVLVPFSGFPRQSICVSSYLVLVEASGNYERLIWPADANTTPDADAADGSCVFYLGADLLR
jgi:hypothetical protein